MTKTEIFNEPYCEIYMGGNGILYAEWKGFLKPEEIRKGCSTMTKYIEENNITLHLSDHRNLKVLSKEAQDYLVNEWFAEVEKKGLRKVAALVSPDLFAKVTVEKVNNRVNVGSLVIDTFESENACINWLLS